MPARKSPPERPRKASGANIEEWRRRGCKVQYRLTEREAAVLAELARHANTTPSLYALHVMRDRLGPPPPVRDTLEAYREDRDDLAELRADMHPESRGAMAEQALDARSPAAKSPSESNE